MARLRVGILTNSVAALSPWELRLFDKICADDRFDLTAIFAAEGLQQTQHTEQPWWLQKVLELDFAKFARETPRDGALFETALATAKVLNVTGHDALDPASAKSAAKLALDVLLVHGLDELVGSLSSYARFGAWNLRYASQRLQTTAPDQVMACLNLNYHIRVALDVTSNGGADQRTLATAAFNLEKSPATTLVRAAEKSVSLVLRELRRLHSAGQLNSEPQVAVPAERQNSTTFQSALLYSRALTGLAGSKIKKKLAQRSGHQHMRWSLYFGYGAFDPAALVNTVEVPSADGEFWADPFLFQKDGQTFVFFENYVYRTGQGKITAGVYRDGRLQVLGDALDLPYHVSFPFVFEHNGEIYLMPETCGAQRVEIWRAIEFPLRWERHSVALQGQSVADPVLLHDAGRWWLFANISETPFEDHCNELHLFEVDGPALTRITPHPRNPVVIGSDTARNAGRIVRRAGKLLRTSQNNARGIYGYGLNIMEITTLDGERYEERLATTVAPTFRPQLIGCHHMDQVNGLFVVDGCRKFA
jgi:hypothetical protein